MRVFTIQVEELQNLEWGWCIMNLSRKIIAVSKQTWSKVGSARRSAIMQAINMGLNYSIKLI